MRLHGYGWRDVPPFVWVVLGCGLCLGLFVLPDVVEAQTRRLTCANGVCWDPDERARLERQARTELIMLRFGLMSIATLIGFALGWLGSPEAAPLRKVLLAVLAGAAALVGLLAPGELGWIIALIVAIGGFAIGLGYFAAKAWAKFKEPQRTFGSAQWATADHLDERGLLSGDGITLGSFTDEDGNVSSLKYGGDRHLMTIAPTRSGKGVCHVIPNLLMHEGSVLVIDPKGENAMITAAARQEMGQTVHILDPWGITGGASGVTGLTASRFNPLDWLDASDPDCVENAMILADALIIESASGDAFWTEEAKALLQGIILFTVTDEEEEGQRHLPRVRDLLLLDARDMETLFQTMVESKHHIVSSCGARCLQKDPKLMANVLASAQAQTHFLDSARIRDSLMASDFDLADLKRTRMSLYLVLPADRLNAFGKWMRLVIQQAVTITARDIATKPERPVLFLLDEMAALGKLTSIEQAYGLMAGFGMQLWGIVQDMGQLKRLYGDAHESFIANSGAVSYFGSPDTMSADYFSKLCGVTTVWNLSYALAKTFGWSRGSGANGGSSNRSTADTHTTAAAQRPLAFPDELMRLRGDKQLVLIEQTDPIMATKERWFDDPMYRSRATTLPEVEITASSKTKAKPLDGIEELLDAAEAS